MNFLPLIEAKRDGARLSAEQIQKAVAAFTSGAIPDYQMAAFLMAIYFRGLDTEETRALTIAMRDSGETLQFPGDPRPLVDKHSTGGVGDKVSLPLAPLLACLGFRVPMISGRGLGITGGTLDKLESIPGFQTRRTPEQIVEQVQKIGCCICGQSETMTPADRVIYALRDVTATVPSIPLITASILSKKLAENLDALILDVKFGAAAFMQNQDDARKLAQAMVQLGNECGTQTRAMLTPMDAPLGSSAGNWQEVVETHNLLAELPTAENPSLAKFSLYSLVIECAAQLLAQTSGISVDSARDKAEYCVASGEPLQRWLQMLEAQGADLEAYHEKLKSHHAPVEKELFAPKSGFITRCDARIIGEVVRDLGGGRLTKDSVINHSVGVSELAGLGFCVNESQPLCRVHAASEDDAEMALHRLASAFTISDAGPVVPPMVAEVIS